MSYVPKVGDKVRWPHWADGRFVTILAVDGSAFWALQHNGTHASFDVEDVEEWGLDGEWSIYVEPVVYPERWFNVYQGYVSNHRLSRSEADSTSSADRIGVLHLLPDGSTAMEAP